MKQLFQNEEIFKIVNYWQILYKLIKILRKKSVPVTAFYPIPHLLQVLHEFLLWNWVFHFFYSALLLRVHLFVFWVLEFVGSWVRTCWDLIFFNKLFYTCFLEEGS